MNRDDSRYYDIEKLKRDRTFTERSLAHCREELEALRKERGFSLFRREESDEMEYFKRKISKYEEKLAEIDRKLGGDYSASAEDDRYARPSTHRSESTKRRTFADGMKSGIERPKARVDRTPKKKRASGTPQSNKIKKIVAMVIIAYVIAFVLGGGVRSIFEGGFDEPDYEEITTTTDYGDIKEDVEAMVDDYAFEDTPDITDKEEKNGDETSYFLFINVDGYNMAIGMFGDTPGEASKYLRLSYIDSDTKSPVKIPDENIAGLFSDLISYCAGESSITSEGLEEFTSQIPKAKYTKKGSFSGDLLDYSDVSGSIEYSSSFPTGDERYNYYSVSIYGDDE